MVDLERWIVASFFLLGLLGETKAMPGFLVVVFLSLGVCSSYKGLVKDQTPKLIRLVTISRHGARTPVHTIPNRPCPNFTLPAGELTSVGEQEQFELGKEIRRTYPDIPVEYTPNQFYFRASEYNRTIQSGLSFIRGLFTNESEPNKTLPVCVFVGVVMFYFVVWLCCD